jgi:hypothetical protein
MIARLDRHGITDLAAAGRVTMAGDAEQIEIYLEVGQKKVFAGALDWPGWCRAAGDEATALAALAAYAPRYARIFSRSKVDFVSPDGPAAFAVIERLKGSSTTDFGAPDQAPTRDAEPFDEAARERSEAILAAIWRAFDRTVAAAEGKELRKGPRGGGRDLDGVVRHVLGADAAYLRRVAQRFSGDEGAPLDTELRRTRGAIRAALEAGAHGEIPAKGPRGGALWTPRYFVRRVAWHNLDHLWEIEDRVS